MLRIPQPDLAAVTVFPSARRTVPAMLAAQAERYGDRPLFACADVQWSYAETRPRKRTAATAPSC